jgi:hypothetical protein
MTRNNKIILNNRKYRKVKDKKINKRNSIKNKTGGSSMVSNLLKKIPKDSIPSGLPSNMNPETLQKQLTEKMGTDPQTMLQQATKVASGNMDKKKAEMAAKRAKQLATSTASAIKSPTQYLLDYLLYTLYTMMSVFIYYPTYWVNLPNTTLESVIPTREGCKTLIGNERICKKKIKCLFQKCSLFEDPIGYKLDKMKEKAQSEGKKLRKSRKVQMIMKGGKRISMRKYKKQKAPSNVFDVMDEETKDFLSELYATERKKESQFYKLMKKNTKGGSMGKNLIGKMAKSNFAQKQALKMASSGMKNLSNTISDFLTEDSDRIEQKTCVNQIKKKDGTTMTNNIMCSSSKPVDYDESEVDKNVLFKLLFGKSKEERLKETTEKSVSKMQGLLGLTKSIEQQGGGNVEEHEEFTFTDKEITEEFVREQLSEESIMDFMLLYKMLKMVFDDEVQNEEMVNYDKNLKPEAYGVEVAFPWKVNVFFASPEERKKCLLTHLTTSDLGDDFKQNDLYDKCFVCKNCTLANTSFKVWENVVKSLFVSKKNDFRQVIQNLYYTVKKYFSFNLMDIKQYYMVSILSMQLVHPLLNINELGTIKDSLGNTINFRELIFGIPVIEKNSEIPEIIKDKVRESFVMFKMMNIEHILYDVYYKVAFKQILNTRYQEQRLNLMKTLIEKNYERFYGRRKILVFDNNPISVEDMNLFNIVPYIEGIDRFNTEYESTNENDESKQELYTKIREKMKELVPLYNQLLNSEKYNELEYYKNNNDNYMKHFQYTVDKVNHLDDKFARTFEEL